VAQQPFPLPTRKHAVSVSQFFSRISNIERESLAVASGATLSREGRGHRARLPADLFGAFLLLLLLLLLPSYGLWPSAPRNMSRKDFVRRRHRWEDGIDITEESSVAQRRRPPYPGTGAACRFGIIQYVGNQTRGQDNSTRHEHEHRWRRVSTAWRSERCERRNFCRQRAWPGRGVGPTGSRFREGAAL
jgi:hypothetical protein